MLCSYLPGVEISLIESSDVPTIGVGESTNLTMRGFQSLLADFDEREFMRATNSAYKIAIQFENFSRQGETFLHPFGASAVPGHDGMFMHNAQALHLCTGLVNAGNGFSKRCDYSYQIDAGLYAEFLKQRFKKKGVRHIVDTIQQVVKSESGEIARIETVSGQTLAADLYVDCTGFTSLLLDNTMNEPFQSSAKYLRNDRAIAARTPYQDKATQLKTVTRCTALSAGWVWRIPLWSRLGTGYVYSSQYCTQDEAEAEYREHMGSTLDKDARLGHIQIRVGRHERAWVENCVGIGISYGFLEPLESTGLSLTQLSIVDLASTLAKGYSSRLEQVMFNLRQSELFDSTRDFIVAHYILTEREDSPYWKDLKYRGEVPDRLAEILLDARHRRYTRAGEAHSMYKHMNWNLILSGMGYFKEYEEVQVKPKQPAAQNHAEYLAKHIYGENQTKPKFERKTDVLNTTWLG